MEYDIVQYGTNLTEQDEIKSFLKCIGSMKCKCMLTVKTMWEENKWLIRGYYPHDEKLISGGSDDCADVYDIKLEKHIKIPIEEIECISINERCYIRIYS